MIFGQILFATLDFLLVGLILVILTPFRNLFKNPKSRIVVILFTLIFLLSLYFILINMVGL